MRNFFPEFTHCLEHQLPEDQASPVGLVCSLCKQRLYVQPPQGKGFSCWESQPGAYTLEGDPCFVYTMVWTDFRIRSLHPAGVLIDTRSLNASQELSSSPSFLLSPEELAEIDRVHSQAEEENPLIPDEDEFGLWRKDDDEIEPLND